MSARPLRAEIMDDPRTDPAEISRAFRFIRWTNRNLRGTEGLLTHLERIRGDRGSNLALLDVGTGCGDIPIAALRWAERCGVDLRVVGVDSLPASLDDARREITRAASVHPRGREAIESRIELVRADAFELGERFVPGSFDVVHAGMFLHHFTDDQIVTLLGVMARLASQLVVWNDLSRDPASRVAIRLLTLPMSRVVRHDAVLSVDKGFLEEDARSLIARAGLPPPTLTRWTWAGRFSAAIPVGSKARRIMEESRESPG